MYQVPPVGNCWVISYTNQKGKSIYKPHILTNLYDNNGVYIRCAKPTCQHCTIFSFQPNAPGISSSLVNASALNPLNQGEYSFRFPGSFWNPRIDDAISSTCRKKLFSFLFSNSLLPLGPSSVSTFFANFCWIENMADKKLITV